MSYSLDKLCHTCYIFIKSSDTCHYLSLECVQLKTLLSWSTDRFVPPRRLFNMEDLIFASLATPTPLQASPWPPGDGFLLVPTGGNLSLSICSTGNVARLWPFQISKRNSFSTLPTSASSQLPNLIDSSSATYSYCRSWQSLPFLRATGIVCRILRKLYLTTYSVPLVRAST